MVWIIETGYVDIITEVSLLSIYLAMPRQGHLEEVLDVMGHLKLTGDEHLTHPILI